MSYYLATEEGGDTQRFSGVRIFKVGAAVIGGACLVLLSMVGISTILQNTNATESTDLIGMPLSLRSGAMNGIGQGFKVPPQLASIPGASPWKELALAGLEAAQSCQRDVSAKASHARFNSIVAGMSKKDLTQLAFLKKKVQQKARVIKKQEELKPAPFGLTIGMVPPVKGLWDPFTLSSQCTEGELLYFREAELKHGRVCMVASLGFVVQERFHPFFGGNDVWDGVAAIRAPTVAEVGLFWPVLLVTLAIPEFASIGRIDYASDSAGFTPSLKAGEVPGELGFDPLGLRPKDDPEEWEKLQNRELLNGRLAMIAAAGMIAQELFTGLPLDQGGIYDYR